MKRSLVKYERFEQLKKNSFSSKVIELAEAEEHLARTLDIGSLVMESFNDSEVIYQKDDGTYLKANYSVEEDAVTFDNLEELVLDDASETNKRKEVVGNMLEAILSDKQGEAEVAFDKYMEFASRKIKRDGTLLPPEVVEESDSSPAVRLYNTRGKNGSPKIFKRKGSKDQKKSAAAKKAHRNNKSSYAAGGRKRHANLTKERRVRSAGERKYSTLHTLSGGKQYKRKHMNEWITLTNNVFQYADIIENGYVLQESVIRTDAQGEITGVKIPSSKARNEGKIIKMHYDT